MEAALLSGVLNIAGKKLAPLLTSEFASIMGVTKDLSDLQRLFGRVTSWLSHVGVNIADNGPSFYWVKDLKAVADDFDDLLDEVHLEAEKRNNDWYAKMKSVLSRPKMAQEIKIIKKRFDAIVKERIDFNAIANGPLVGRPVQHTNKRIREMSILGNINETKVLGRDEDKHKIVSKLVEAGTRERISIVSIVGLGGSGKTTLAKYICQDNKIKKHFEDDVFWVDVSQEFNVEKLIGKLFESISDKKSEHHALQHMSRTISEKLSGRKFLLVLDDVWNKDQYDWEQFEQHFNSGAPGSKILLTTRDEEVTEVVKSIDKFNLEFLSNDDSMKLFQQSFGWAEEGLNPEFIEVGQEIVKKCGGVPLAIKALAGVLCDKSEIRQWRALRDSNLLNVLDIKDRVLGSLRLSYFHLPDDLKQCFLLCSIFPKGYDIDKDHLISQWIAHGFVNPMNGGQLPEDVGSDYFDSLLKVSFLQDLVKNPFTGRLKCKMHDLVHDLTREIRQDEIVLTPNKTSTDHNQRCRYLSLASCTEKVDRKLFNKARALYVTGGSCATDKPIKKGCRVRSIILVGTRDTSVLLSKFEYLGYLRITYLSCRELPEAITGCWNLQALHVIDCHKFAMLPESIGKLQKLRTLEIFQACNFKSLPESIGDCHNLESLHLVGCQELREIPDSLDKNKNLRLLNIVNCRIFCQLPSESFGMLRKLQTINLSRCESLEDLPSSFACDELHTLKLNRVTKLTVLPQGISSLSNLEHLDLGYCSGLVELPEGIVHLKRLEVLNLEGCRRLRGLPAGFAQLTRLQKLGLFVIGDSSEHARISELGNLYMIRGTLEISGIRTVKDTEDAEKAYLKKKNNIDRLKLDWSWTATDQEIDMEQELAVLNGLEPPSGIKQLGIHNYPGLHLPHWFTKKSVDSIFKQTVDLPHFPHLTEVSLVGFGNLKHLTGLAQLPSLKTLFLIRFDALESISAGPFPSLTELHIYGMPHLLELSTMTKITLADEDGVIVCGNQEVQCCFPRLSTLRIDRCRKLNVKPWFPASLESLTLRNSNEGLLFPGSSLWPVHPHGDKSEWPTSCSNSNGASSCSSLLKKLELSGMKGSSSGSGWELLQHLTALESLQILDCNELRQLPECMRSLTALQELEIMCCSGLCMLPEWLGELRSLQRLQIAVCSGLRELSEGIQHLTSLRELLIQGYGALHQLPEGLGGLRSLRRLSVEYLRSLSCLPESMRGLTSLEYLQISECDALHRLPEGLGELSSLRALTIQVLPGLSCLPESMRGLTSLEYLQISECDALHRLPEGLGKLSSLRELTIQVLPGLSCLPDSMRGLTSLQRLEISECDALHRLPEGLGELSSLRELTIWKLPGLSCLPDSMRGLTSLKRLEIYECDALHRLPDQLGELRSLRTLRIGNLHALTLLPESIGQLSALRWFSAWGCPGLTSLPRSIGRLTALRGLYITGNPDLARRYKQGSGKDWHLISHIPKIDMD